MPGTVPGPHSPSSHGPPHSWVFCVPGGFGESVACQVGDASTLHAGEKRLAGPALTPNVQVQTGLERSRKCVPGPLWPWSSSRRLGECGFHRARHQEGHRPRLLTTGCTSSSSGKPHIKSAGAGPSPHPETRSQQHLDSGCVASPVSHRRCVCGRSGTTSTMTDGCSSWCSL